MLSQLYSGEMTILFVTRKFSWNCLFCTKKFPDISYGTVCCFFYLFFSVHVVLSWLTGSRVTIPRSLRWAACGAVTVSSTTALLVRLFSPECEPQNIAAYDYKKWLLKLTVLLHLQLPRPQKLLVENQVMTQELMTREIIVMLYVVLVYVSSQCIF